MNVDPQPAVSTEIYTTAEGHAVIEQAGSSIVLRSAEQIQHVIETLHVCYDYCAAWKDPTTPR